MDYQASIPLTMCLSKNVLQAGTTTTVTTVPTGATSQVTVYVIKGKIYNKAALTNVATPTVDFSTGTAFKPIPIPNTAPNTALGYGCVFTVGLNAAGTLKVVQGTIEALDVSGNFINAPQFGGVGVAGPNSGNSDFCPIGYIIVQLGATAVATWTFGTNNLSSVTGVTYTFVDVCTLPDRPQVS